MSIFTILFVVLLVAWLLGLSVFHVAGGLIHILLIVAVISLILHFVRGSLKSTTKRDPTLIGTHTSKRLGRSTAGDVAS